MQAAPTRDPGILGDRSERVWLWNECPDRDGPDTGIDLVAEEREGGLCVIQCKFFDPHRPVLGKPSTHSWRSRSRHSTPHA